MFLCGSLYCSRPHSCKSNISYNPQIPVDYPSTIVWLQIQLHYCNKNNLDLFCVVVYNVNAQFKDQPIPYAFFYSRYTIKSIKENKEKIEALNDTI